MLFDSSKISHLRAKIAAESDVKNPTRFEVVTAVLNRCVAMSSPFKPFAIYCPVNNRKLTTPPLPSNIVGNFGAPIVSIIDQQQDLELPILVAKLRTEKDQVYKNYNNIGPNDKDKLVSAAIEDLGKFPQNMRTILTSSWLKMPFYDVDFGWGRPFKALPLPPPVEDCFILMDDRNGDGVYAIVTLHEEVMAKFEVDKELLEFACSDDACF
ncbi:hypothetical protein LIER_11177 [Lithospermum erythrorhizon]|uniref:Uncharacterized protein n=1 Tax=Lithospermum erythrorhizon TaxID=34254 RepID=A0AAV3PNA6_LITER